MKIKNKWAKVGDLLFMIPNKKVKEKVLPCKVIDIQESEDKADYIFTCELIDPRDVNKISKDELTFSLITDAGKKYFLKKNNAISYIEDGSIDVMKSMLRNLKNHSAISDNNPTTISKNTIAAAFVIAINQELGIGIKRFAPVLNSVNQLMKDLNDGKITEDVILETAKSKMPIDSFLF